MRIIGSIAGAIAVVVLFVLFIWPQPSWFGLNDDDKDSKSEGEVASVTSSEDAAELFGGDEDNWKMAKGSNGAGWIYSSTTKTNLNIPEGYRIDYPLHSCAEAKGKGGVYGPAPVENIRIATVWDVPGETECPAGSKFTLTQVETEKEDLLPDDEKPGLGTTKIANGNSCADAVKNAEGYPGPTTAQAKISIGLDVQRLGTECSAFVFRDPSGKAHSATCEAGYVCTLTLAGGEVKVYVGDDKARNASAGTFRFKEVYMASDKVRENPPCALARSEDKFGRGEDPSFVATAGNFKCAADSGIKGEDEPTALTCGDPSTDLGGGTWVRNGDKMSLQGKATIHGHKAWTVHTNKYSGDPGLPPGVSETTSGASAYCDPYKG